MNKFLSSRMEIKELKGFLLNSESNDVNSTKKSRKPIIGGLSGDIFLSLLHALRTFSVLIFFLIEKNVSPDFSSNDRI